MFSQMSFERFKELACEHDRVAVFQEVPGDQTTPVNAYLALNEKVQSITLLESLVHKPNAGRYSHLCFNPIFEFESRGNTITTQQNTLEETTQADPLSALRDYQKKYHAATDHPLSGFAGGMIGLVTYDAIRLSESIPDNNTDLFGFPDLLFRFYQDNISFDHQSRKVVISSIVETKNVDLKAVYDGVFNHINTVKNDLLTFTGTQTPFNTLSNIDAVEVTTDINDSEYCAMVEKAKTYITRGDAFQIVPSRNFTLKCNAKPFDVYRALRFTSPTPYMFYLTYKDCVITGASPEKLVSLDDTRLESCPLAGTRPRAEGVEDLHMERELKNDIKENAEHMMLVDLARNDLGTIATPGTVEVCKLKEIERTSHVMHISSTVNATINSEYDALDALIKSMPAGTLSGAPKIRAMHIIDDIETTRRGIYGGAIGGIDSHGNLASCIAIRMAVIKDGVATIRAGGGVVYDSDPQKEADETRAKASTVIAAIKMAEGELS
jgi:anthranilate synthase component I